MAKVRNPIPKRLKEARLQKGISQKSLGIAAGIDEFSASARMNQYETGKHIPDYVTLKRIASVLEVPVPFFYSEDDQLSEVILLFAVMQSNKRMSSKAIKLLKNLA